MTPNMDTSPGGMKDVESNSHSVMEIIPMNSRYEQNTPMPLQKQQLNLGNQKQEDKMVQVPHQKRALTRKPLDQIKIHTISSDQ